MILQELAKRVMGLSFFFVVPTILFLCLNARMGLSASMSKPGCPDRCGNVTIPYPFGIGSGCSANFYFTVTCQQSSTATPKPILNIIKLEVLDISLVGTIIVNLHVSPLSCHPEGKTHTLLSSLQGSPFAIAAQDNTFVNIGCQISVWLHNSNETDTVISGCMAICSPNSTTGCRGINCCTAIISKRLREFRYTYKSSIDQRGNGSFCGYAFPVKTEWLQPGGGPLQDYLNNSFNKDFGFVPIVLEWEVDNRHLSAYGNSCPKEHYGNTGCYCAFGYEGNPYLPEGCSDVDECNTTGHSCSELGSCYNTYGGYECRYLPRGYHHNQSRIKVALVVAGSVIGSFILLYGAWWCGQTIRKVVKAVRSYRFYKHNGGLLLEQHLTSTEKGIEKIKVFNSKELLQATDHYNENRILGRGGQGTVYKGMLSDGRIVAVKKSKKVDEGNLAVFINEVVILSQINHRNIVKLIGCCLETEVPLLVYEFIPNGTLFHHIHEPTEELPFTWARRIRIATEVAGALAYLHSASSAPVYHRDVKSSNILLDDKYRAKVADFGISRSVAIDQTHLTTRVIGTFGYVDPEYFLSSQLTEKSDVYSFGVIMVELLTGEKVMTSIRAASGKSLATHFLHSMEDNRLFDILDSRVLEEAKREEIVAVAELARRCLHLNGRRRPTMREVAANLEGIQSGVNADPVSLQHDDCSTVQPYHDSSDYSSITISSYTDTNHTDIAGNVSQFSSSRCSE